MGDIGRSAEQVKDNTMHALDTTGLSDRVFDVFAATAKRGYLFLCNMKTNVSRWSRRAMADFDMPGEYMYDAGAIWEKRVHPDDLAMYQESIKRIFDGTSMSQNLMYRAKNTEGKYVMCSCESAVFKSKDGEIDYFAGTITNYGIMDEVDNVTHLSSKSAFLERLEEMTEEDRSTTVMMLVIDKLSSINTLYGYRFGDEVLRFFGAELQKIVGERGTVYHMDTSMYGVCMHDMDRAQTKLLYEAIRAMAYRGFDIGDKHVTCRVLGSAAIFGNAHGETDRITANLGYAIGQSMTIYHGDIVFYNMEKHKHEFGDRDMIGTIYQQIMTDFSGFSLYSNLVAIHNRVVSAHRQIENDSLDEKLVALGEKITQVNTYNLNDMSDEEIDMLIDTMDSIIDTYEEYLTAINDIRDTENAAILTPINVSLVNDTNLTFAGLSLHQKGTIENVDLLETLSGFMPAQRMAGLVIYRDVQNTPWVLELVSEDGSLYELNLSVKDYSEDGCVLTLTYDSEKDAILIG